VGDSKEIKEFASMPKIAAAEVVQTKGAQSSLLEIDVTGDRDFEIGT